jgi:hypothetical protein
MEHAAPEMVKSKWMFGEIQVESHRTFYMECCVRYRSDTLTRCLPSVGQSLSAVALFYGVSRVLFVVADVLDHVGVGAIFELERDGERLAVCEEGRELLCRPAFGSKPAPQHSGSDAAAGIE